MHPVFMEIVLTRRASYKVSLVDITNSAEINIVTSSESRQDINENIIFFNLGITVF